MKTVGLLFFVWSVAWFPAGLDDRSLSVASVDAVRFDGLIAQATVDRPADRMPLGWPGDDDLGAYLWDSEDSSDGDPGDVLDTGFGFASPVVAEQAALGLFATTWDGAFGTSCQRLPLRC